MADGGRSPDNRTTAKNAWRPPSASGTTSPQRALRWQAAGQESAAEKVDQDDARSAKSGKSGASGKSKSSSKKEKKEKKEAKKAEAVPVKTEPDLLDWYGPPSFGEDASLGPGGSLHAFTKSGRARPGMCNPPMNPEIAAMLVADLNRWKVQPIVKTKKDIQREEAKRKREEEALARRNTMTLPSSPSHHEGELHPDLQAAGGGDPAAATAPPGGFFGGSSGSSRLPSPAPTSSFRRTASVPANTRVTVRGGSPFVKARKKRGESTWQLDMTQEGKFRPTLDTAPEGEVKWRSRQLRSQCREHGFVLEKADVEELGHLSMYHNWLSRNMHSQHPPPAPHPVAHSRQVRALNCELGETSQSLPSISTHAAKIELGCSAMDELGSPARRPPRIVAPLGPSQEAPSAERLLEMASSVMHAGPHMLQLMCQNTGISVHTGSKLQALPEPSSSQPPDEDDPLFSGRLGSSPRTQTGKPLPVPYWGRNGSAPVLRDGRKG